MLLIGFGNRARHGKDTVVEAILDHYADQNHAIRKGYGNGAPQTRVWAFKYATALYKEVADYIGSEGGPVSCFAKIARAEAFLPTPYGKIMIPTWVTMGDPTPSNGLTAPAPYGKHPKLLQFWGTEYRRKEFGENYWVDRMFASIPANLDIALISDVRFPNEADGIKQRGGYTVNVTRLREDGTPYRSSDRPVDHPSETALDDYNWQFRLSNPEGHQAWLEEQAITLVEYLRGIHQ